MAAPTDAALSAPVVRVALCCFMDIGGDPFYYALAPAPLTMPAVSLLTEPDPDFDGKTFTTVDPRLISVPPVSHGPAGVEAVDFVLSGTLEMDAAILTVMSNKALFGGRVTKLWLVCLDDAFLPVAARQYYAGYMSVPSFSLEPPDENGVSRQTVTIKSENYLALIGGGAPSRTLLSTPDPGDHAADATTGALGAGAALGVVHGGMGAAREPRNWEREK